MTCEDRQDQARHGRLPDCLLPAVYFETSVIVDYWSAEAIEASRRVKECDTAMIKGEFEQATSELFSYTIRLEKMADVRELLQLSGSAYTAVTSPLAIHELAEWHAHASFKQIAAQTVGIVPVDRMSRKEVGDYLKKIYRDGSNEMLDAEDHYNVNQAPNAAVLRECLLNLSFLECHGLDGVLNIDINGLAIGVTSFFSKSAIFAYHRIGLADVMHLAAASHIGCSHFASFDSDFKRCREFIGEVFGLTLIASVDELLRLLR